MPLSRTWYTRGNVPLSDYSTALLAQASIYWGLKALLMGQVATGDVGPEGAAPAGAAWTCVGSSDGVTAGLDAVDRWGAAFDGSKIVYGAGAAAHSWIVLQSPAAMGPYYFLLSRTGGGAAYMTARGSKTAFTGGTVNADPTSTTSWDITLSPAMETLAVLHRLNFTVDAAGNFYFHVARNGTGIFNMTLWFQTLAGVQANDLHPVFSHFAYLTTGRGAGDPSDGGAVKGRDAVNSAALTGGALQMAFGPGPSYIKLMTANLDGAFDTFKWPVLSYNPALNGLRGYFPDVHVIGVAPVGGSYPSTVAQEQMVVGNFLVPSSVVPVL